MLQRKALTANDFANLETVAQHLYKFERYYESIAQPFEGEVQSERKLRRADLNALIAHMRSPDVAPKRVEIGRLDEYVRKFMKSRT